MKTFVFSLFALALGLGSGWCKKEEKEPAAAETAAPKESGTAIEGAIPALEDSAMAYVEAFNKGDSGALADQFLPDGEMILLSGAAIRGREAIKEHYDEVFAGGEKFTVSYESGAARMLTNGVVVEDAVMSFAAPSGEISVHPYTAVHVKQADGSWLLARVRDLSGDFAQPTEKLRALEWMIGDWVIQVDDSDTWISDGTPAGVGSSHGVSTSSADTIIRNGRPSTTIPICSGPAASPPTANLLRARRWFRSPRPGSRSLGASAIR